MRVCQPYEDVELAQGRDEFTDLFLADTLRVIDDAELVRVVLDVARDFVAGAGIVVMRGFRCGIEMVTGELEVEEVPCYPPLFKDVTAFEGTRKSSQRWCWVLHVVLQHQQGIFAATSQVSLRSCLRLVMLTHILFLEQKYDTVSR